MKGVIFNVEGNWGHFRKPETNNNPLTHDFITKTALVGLIGAVLGKNRKDMNDLFPILTDSLVYGVQVLNDVKKLSFGFSSRKLGGSSKGEQQSRKRMEILKDPNYKIALAVKSNDAEVFYDEFVAAVKNNVAGYTPVFGIHNCPANLDSKSVVEGNFVEKGSLDEEFEISSFVALNYQELTKISQTKQFHIGIDRIPTYQKDFFNPLDKFVTVAYPSNGNTVKAKGKFFEFNDESKWALI